MHNACHCPYYCIMYKFFILATVVSLKYVSKNLSPQKIFFFPDFFFLLGYVISCSFLAAKWLQHLLNSVLLFDNLSPSENLTLLHHECSIM